VQAWPKWRHHLHRMICELHACNTRTRAGPCIGRQRRNAGGRGFDVAWRYIVCDFTDHLSIKHRGCSLNLRYCAMLAVWRLHCVHTLIKMYAIPTLFFHTLVTC
jgi:hypothetical protein